MVRAGPHATPTPSRPSTAGRGRRTGGGGGRMRRGGLEGWGSQRDISSRRTPHPPCAGGRPSGSPHQGQSRGGAPPGGQASPRVLRLSAPWGTALLLRAGTEPGGQPSARQMAGPPGSMSRARGQQAPRQGRPEGPSVQGPNLHPQPRVASALLLGRPPDPSAPTPPARDHDRDRDAAWPAFPRGPDAHVTPAAPSRWEAGEAPGAPARRSRTRGSRRPGSAGRAPSGWPAGS